MLVSDHRLLLPETDPHVLAVIKELGLTTQQNSELKPGIYQVDDFNAPSFIRKNFNEYPDLKEFEEFDFWASYGVCDSVENLLEVAPWIEESSRKFLVLLNEVQRDQSNLGSGGGWRWHKWGPYIGTQDPQCEHLDDEPLIERIYCFQIYESVGPSGA